MSRNVAEAVADAVLYEGYLLYPYRASAMKNRLRWQVGLVMPRSYAEAAASDPWFTHTECLVEAGPAARLTVHARALHLQERIVEEALGRNGEQWRTVPSLTVGARQLIGWDEAVASEWRGEAIQIRQQAEPSDEQWVLARFSNEERIEHDGRLAARLVRRRSEVQAAIRTTVEPCGRLFKIRVRIENHTPCSARTLAERDHALRYALAGTHLLLTIADGAFVSLLEPPAGDAALAAGCVNQHTFPVLVGSPGSTDTMLSSPIILYDYPAIAPESAGDFFDATEIDELLTLRVQTMTDEEKQEARATDDRAAGIIDRCDVATPESMRTLHGATRHFATAQDDAWQQFLNPPQQPAPEEATIAIGAVTFRRGLRVRLEPSRRADSMDICLRGRLATVSAVYRTLEDAPYVAVVLDDDPFGAAGASYRRALFFHPDELVALATDTGSVP